MKPTFLLLLGTLLFFNCKKDSYTNLSATLSPDSSFITAYEGDPLIMNLSFDKKLSEPIQIVGKIHNDHTNFINQEDYHPFLEYSTDLGKTWRKGKGSYSIIVQKKQSI
jgi:hypothetical protein